MKIYTKTGDAGDTGLFGGGRVPKDHPRVAAYGDVDELNSAIGVARATAPPELFDAAARRRSSATSSPSADTSPRRIRRRWRRRSPRPTWTEARVAAFERADGRRPNASSRRSAPSCCPAGTPKAAALHLARTVCRRAERSVVRLAHESRCPRLFLVYLNRLSDLLFTLARLANHRAGAGDVTW